jgi:hypothetical protein
MAPLKKLGKKKESQLKEMSCKKIKSEINE